MPASLRSDLSVGHDSRAFAVTSRAGEGCCEGLEPGSPEWVSGVERGAFLPIGLDGDRGGTCVRIVLDSALSEAESEEWVDHFSGRLDVNDGRLIVCGSTDFLDEQQFVDSDMVQELSVPPGMYQVDVHACFVGINGWGADRDGLIVPADERVGAWFRRTRPGEPFPLWLRLRCHEDPGHDPGHESQWEGSDGESDDLDEDQETSWVDFIVRLTRVDATDTFPSAPLDSEGFTPVRVSPRLPDKCPLGLRATLNGD